MKLFELIDKTNRLIYLTDERWSHIVSEHDALVGNLEKLKDTITNPLIVLGSNDNQKINFYYRYYKDRDTKERYLLVLVKYLNGIGFIITSFFTHKLKGAK